MSDNLAHDIELLNAAAKVLIDTMNATMKVGTSASGEVGNYLEEALSQRDDRFGSVWRFITGAESDLDAYQAKMSQAVEVIHRIIMNLNAVR